MDYGLWISWISWIRYPHSIWIWIGFGFMNLLKMDYGLDLDYDFNPSGPTACVICLTICKLLNQT